MNRDDLLAFGKRSGYNILGSSKVDSRGRWARAPNEQNF
jgi:hypothetical protein